MFKETTYFLNSHRIKKDLIEHELGMRQPEWKHELDS